MGLRSIEPKRDETSEQGDGTALEENTRFSQALGTGICVKDDSPKECTSGSKPRKHSVETDSAGTAISSKVEEAVCEGIDLAGDQTLQELVKGIDGKREVPEFDEKLNHVVSHYFSAVFQCLSNALFQYTS